MLKKILTVAIALLVCSGSTQIQSQGLFGTLVGNSIVARASTWENKFYRKGQSLQCANFVAEVVSSAGIEPPSGFSLARSWLAWGKPVVGGINHMRPGDVIVLWRGSRSGTSGHILIYVGNGECLHRPTYSKAVSRISIDVYKSRILGIRRATTGN
jgi:cell wall-associated NlpC family hydrolase